MAALSASERALVTFELFRSKMEKKGAAWSSERRCYLKKGKVVPGITQYITNVASSCMPAPCELYEIGDDEEDREPTRTTVFLGSGGAMPCAKACKRTRTGRLHGTLVHEQITDFLSRSQCGGLGNITWDPCLLALLQSLRESRLTPLWNEYVMVSDANWGTAADLIATDSSGLPVVIELKCTRGDVHARFSPFPATTTYTGALLGMPVNEYTSAQVQLLIMVVLLQREYGIPIVGKVGTWAERSARAIVIRVGRDPDLPESSLVRLAIQNNLDQRVWNAREKIMTVFETHVSMKKGASKRTAKRARTIAKMARASNPALVEERKRQRKLMNKNRRERTSGKRSKRKNGRCLERAAKLGLECIHQATVFARAAAVSRSKRS
jgi:hypothetical protein